MAASGSNVSSNPPKPKSSGVVVPNRPTFAQSVAAWIAYVLLRCVAATLRYRWTDRSGFFVNLPAGQTIYCIWHNRLALCMKIYHGYIKRRSRGTGLAAMVSASKDGALLSGVLERFGVFPVRGSTSRRGPQALRELTTLARRGYDLAITPDGPRGPKCVVQEGVMSLAQLTALPIVPVSYRLTWKIRVKSWDQFQIPLPFSRCEMIFDKPINIPREASPEQRELFRKQLETQLREISNDE